MAGLFTEISWDQFTGLDCSEKTDVFVRAFLSIATPPGANELRKMHWKLAGNRSMRWVQKKWAKTQKSATRTFRASPFQFMWLPNPIDRVALFASPRLYFDIIE
jgi:hypothetical protein